jgi:type VI secretion system Hcp family effector
MVAVGAIAGIGGAGTAIALSSSSSSGVIYACVQTVDASGAPVTTAGNLRFIDPSAGQTCNSPAGAPVGEKQISWNVTGPPGKVVTLAGETFTISGLQHQATLDNVSPVPLGTGANGKSIGTVTIGSGRTATQFPILSYALVQSGGAGRGGGGGRNGNEIQFTKKLDKASPTLIKACANGTHFKLVQLVVRKAGGGKYLTIKMSQVLVSSYDENSQKGTSTPHESISLNFTKISYKYY